MTTRARDTRIFNIASNADSFCRLEIYKRHGSLKRRVVVNFCDDAADGGRDRYSQNNSPGFCLHFQIAFSPHTFQQHFNIALIFVFLLFFFINYILRSTIILHDMYTLLSFLIPLFSVLSPYIRIQIERPGAKIRL